MEDPLNESEMRRVEKRRPRWLPWLIVSLILLGGWFYWSHQQSQERRERELIDEGFTLVRVLSSTFTNTESLVVGKLSGTVEVTTRDAGWMDIFPSSQTIRLPATVEYRMDLSQLDGDDYRWDSSSRTLLVELPPVRQSEPNIDESRVEVRDRNGIWISRSAQERLSRRASRGAIRASGDEASKPENMVKARSNAKNAIASLLRAPLDTAGLGDVRVVARFEGEAGTDDPSYMDLSATYNEAIAEARRRRAGEKTQ